MKLPLSALFIFCMIFSSCNHTPKEEQQVISNDSINMPTGSAIRDSIILSDPIVNSIKHYFSDTAKMDSFVVEMPAGNIMALNFLVKIFDSNNNLIYLDSASPRGFINDDLYDEKMKQDDIIKDLKKSIKAAFNIDNFSYSGKEDVIKNASASEIKNMQTWNEAINDTDRVVFNYLDWGKGVLYVSYSQKLKKAAVAIQRMYEGDVD